VHQLEALVSTYTTIASLQFKQSKATSSIAQSIHSISVINTQTHIKMTGTNGANGNGATIGTTKVKQGLAQMLKGGVIVSSFF